MSPRWAQRQVHEPARWVRRQAEETGHAGGGARLVDADAG